MYLVQRSDCHQPIVITWSEGTLAITNSVARPILKEWFLKNLLERQAYDIALFKIAPIELVPSHRQPNTMNK